MSGMNHLSVVDGAFLQPESPEPRRVKPPGAVQAVKASKPARRPRVVALAGRKGSS
jgi:hypothetical protein